MNFDYLVPVFQGRLTPRILGTQMKPSGNMSVSHHRSNTDSNAKRILGERVDNITEADLLKEIEKLAVERQRNVMKEFASLLPI